MMIKLEKTCMQHGILQEKDILVCPNENYKLGYFLRCGKCKNEKTWKDILKTCKKHGDLATDEVKASGHCKYCHKLSASRKRNQNREWYNAKMAEDKLKNPEKWDARYKKEYQQSVARIGKEARNTNEIIRLRGLTHDQYEKMINEQNNKCKICNENETRGGRTPGTITRLAVDHCHESGNVRGLLCHRCNAMIGYAQDDLDILEMAIIYLQSHKERPD